MHNYLASPKSQCVNHAQLPDADGNSGGKAACRDRPRVCPPARQEGINISSEKSERMYIHPD